MENNEIEDRVLRFAKWLSSKYPNEISQIDKDFQNDVMWLGPEMAEMRMENAVEKLFSDNK